MSIKSKVAYGVFFLFFLIITISGLGLYYLNNLSNDSENILLDNYESLEYSKRILETCNSLRTNSRASIRIIESNLQQQEQNITESGERVLTLELRSVVEKLKNNGVSDSAIVQIRSLCLKLQDLNMKAIIRKNELSQETAEKASVYLIIAATVCTLAAFIFIVNFPGYIANPITQLTNSIKSIADKNYEERLHFNRADEFEELANAFNQMAEKLDEYEHSNLAKIIFEKKRIETIINRMSDPVIGLNESNQIIFANDQAIGILGVGRSEVMDKYAPDVAVNNDLFRSLIKADESTEDAKPMIKAVMDGRENYFTRESILVNYVPTGEQERVSIGKVLLLKNVTSYKELDLAKTNFMATISHELKTPIASLQMCIKLLQDRRVGSLNEEQESITRTLNDEVTRLSRITNELLDLSQVETGNIKLSIETSDPGHIIRQSLEAVKFQAETKHIQFEVKADAANIGVFADIDKTTWVLVNLLTNAIRYSSDQGTVLITCTHGGGVVKFSVSDDGPGIEEKYIHRIFEKFYQVPGTPNGTGLGLAISKEFIEAQNGKIKVESTAGKGSTFSFELPAGR